MTPKKSALAGRRSGSPDKRASDRLARLYFDYALTGIIETDHDGTIRQANPAAVSITGRDARQLEGTRLEQLFSAQSHDRLQRHWCLLQEQGISQAELRLPLRDGRELVIEMASVQIDEAGFMHIFDDVTVQRRAQEEIEKARIAAESANRAKSEFLANISHEIRTPLNGILGLSQLALQADLPVEVQDYLAAIRRSGKNLLAIVNDLLDAAKIESGKFSVDPQPYRLEDLLADLDDLRASGAHDQSVEVAFSVAPGVPACVLGDRLRSGQCLRNLLGNAVKFTPAGQVSLAVDCLNEDSRDWLRFRVTDTGIGITPEAMARLFAPFSQADASTARRFGGSGLGLYLSRELARSMGGDLRAESRPGEGSRFTLLLPLVPVSVDAARPHSETIDVPQEFRGQLVLLVEDDPTNRLVATHWLAKAGIESRVAHDGHEAIAQAQHPPLPALILMDVQMPGLDGLAATRKLRDLGCTLPIIGLSAGAGQIEQDACHAAGMSDFLPKPIDLDELWGCLTRWLPPTAIPADEMAAGGPVTDDPEILAHLKKTFLATHGEAGIRLQALIRTGDRQQATFIAHTLKGAAALVGLSETYSLASALESDLGTDVADETLMPLCEAIQQQLFDFSALPS
ncbi:MAG: ATP-binding protein [Rhodocyclaceae bacterium]|nr:ATP-binding protein [Rhodocyclaceae bacterium]MDZ4216510.1 ATP-binding protein [Rhodocyclaceae bacterium]